MAKNVKLCLAFGFILSLVACGNQDSHLALSPVSFSDLPEWREDRAGEALPAFLKSCDVFEKRSPTSAFKIKEAGMIADWLAPCSIARRLVPDNHKQARRFFESFFTPYQVGGQEDGLFTGYYEASLKGSLTQGGQYQTPIYAKPDDLVQVDLGAFRKAFAGTKIAGKLLDKKLVPYDQRKEITSGALCERAEVLLWTNDPISTFFLEVQGSGRVEMDTGETIHVGYAGQNGHAYTSIGRALLEAKLLERPITLASIRDWLQKNPERRKEILNKNESYVFFRVIEGEGPLGALGLPLTPLRSLAVDSRYVPLGVPVWLATENHKRLVIAQDVGGAIKGRVRGDLFWGFGSDAEKGAGEMQDRGIYYLLLPKKRGGHE